MWIFGFGGIGGALVWVWEIWEMWQESEPFELSQLLHLPMYVGFGAGAAAVFILLIANSDRSDRMRVVALALLAGFAWKPIWTGSQNLLREPPEKKSEINNPANEAPYLPTDELLVESPQEGSSQSDYRFVNERAMEESEFQGITELYVGDIQQVLADEFRFSVSEGPLVIRTHASHIDLVGTLYQYNNGALKYLAIDDDSGSSFNPKIELEVEGGEYLFALKPYDEDALYGGPISILVSRD